MSYRRKAGPWSLPPCRGASTPCRPRRARRSCARSWARGRAGAGSGCRLGWCAGSRTSARPRHLLLDGGRLTPPADADPATVVGPSRAGAGGTAVTEDAPVLSIDEVREEVAPEVTGKIADTLDVAAERTAPEGSPRSGHPRVRAMMIAAGVAAGGLLAMKALRAVRSAKHDREDAGWDEYDPS